MVALRLVDDNRQAGTDLYTAVPLTLTSKMPGEMQLTRTVEFSDEESSDCNVMIRS